MAESLTQTQQRFVEMYQHLSFVEYRDSDMELEIPKKVASPENWFKKKDVTGRAVQIGDIIVTGNSTYADAHVHVVVGFSPKALRIAPFNRYKMLVGLNHVGSFNSSSDFVILNAKNKPFKLVD